MKKASPNRHILGATLNIAIRLVFAAVLVTTCFYCLLTYIPFTYFVLIQNSFLSWLRFFASFYKFIYLTTVLPLLAVLLHDAKGERTTRLTRGFAVVHIFVGVVLLFSPSLDSLPRDFRSFVWSLLILFPLCWVAAIDHSAFAREGGWSRLPERRELHLSNMIKGALLLAFVFPANSYFRYLASTHQSWLSGMPAVFLSIIAHLILGVFVFAVLAGLREALARSRASAETQFVASSALLWFAGVIILRKIVLPSLSLNNGIGDLFSVVVSLEITVFLTGISVCFYRTFPSDSVDAFTLPLFFLAPLFTKRAFVRILWAFAAAAAAFGTPAVLARGDWDMLLQRIGAVLIWLAAFAFSLGSRHPRGTEKRSPVLILAFLVVAILTFWAGRKISSPRFLDRFSNCDKQNCISDVTEQYVGFDPSFKAIRDVFAPALDDGEHGDFDRFLRRYTNIATPVRPVEVNIAGKLQSTAGSKPNIFLFVIDSLRPDYLSPYNAAVDFTPAIAQFARDSDVMQHAFTRYGGTALAEPSIWAGAMQIHKQYVQPYDSMNALRKLLDVEHYDSYVTIDPILRAILGKPASITELDRDNIDQNYDLCVTLREIENRILTRTDTSKPIFVYTQPLNVHVTGLYYAKSRRRPQRSYPGFDANHAAELERLDTAFGEFIQFLKEHGLYSNTIVVLTSDHGDSIGEYGRYGHTGTPFPEVVRIPLIIHVPTQLRKSLVLDPIKVAFNIDITPTLYYMLGHRDLMVNEIVGRPLYAATLSDLAKWDQPNYLIVSSYLPAYGILGHDGSTLFVTDAQTGTNYFYNLSQDPNGLHNRVTSTVRDEGEQLIRAHVSTLNRFYGLEQ